MSHRVTRPGQTRAARPRIVCDMRRTLISLSFLILATAAQIDWLETTYTFSPRSLVRAVAQQSTISREGFSRDRRCSLSGLYAYKLNWQTVFFVGYGDSSVTADTGALTLDARSVFMKVAYAFQR